MIVTYPNNADLGYLTPINSTIFCAGHWIVVWLEDQSLGLNQIQRKPPSLVSGKRVRTACTEFGDG
jgi:hypothetical protein